MSYEEGFLCFILFFFVISFVIYLTEVGLLVFLGFGSFVFYYYYYYFKSGWKFWMLRSRSLVGDFLALRFQAQRFFRTAFAHHVTCALLGALDKNGMHIAEQEDRRERPRRKLVSTKIHVCSFQLFLYR